MLPDEREVWTMTTQPDPPSLERPTRWRVKARTRAAAAQMIAAELRRRGYPVDMED